MPKPHGDGEILYIYITLLAANCQKLKMAAIGRNM